MEQQVNKIPHFSHSELSAVEKGYAYWKWYRENKNKPKKAYQIFGSAFDCYITQNSDFEKKFMVIKDKPSDFQTAFIDHLILNPDNIEDITVLREQARIIAGYSWDIKQVLNEFNKPKNQEYYEFRLQSKGTNREFISELDFFKIRNMTDSLYSHKLANELLYNKKNIFQHEICEIIPSLSTEYECKVILDVSNPNFIIDIKTSAGDDIVQFQQSIDKFNYKRQLRLYEIVMQEGSPQYKLDNSYLMAIQKDEPYTTGVFISEPFIKSCGVKSDKYFETFDEERDKIIKLIAKYDKLMKGEQTDYIINI